MYVRFSLLLLLVSLAQSYIWTKKKIGNPEGPHEMDKPRRRPKPDSKYVKATIPKTVLKPGILANVEVFMNGDWNTGINVTLSAEECTRQVDLSTIIAPKVGITMDVTLYTFYGRPVRTCADAIRRVANSEQVSVEDLFIVPPGRIFQLPAKRIGDKLYMYHIDTADNTTVQLEVVSVEPRIFKVRHFVSPVELKGLLQGAKNGTKLERNLTNGRYNAGVQPMNHTITPELSETVKMRLFKLLGIHPYQPPLSEDIETVHYNVTGAYAPHLHYLNPPEMLNAKHKTQDKADLIKGNSAAATTTHYTNSNSFKDPNTDFYYEGHDYDSAHRGHNRYASLLLYMDTPKLGGEVVFSMVPSPNKDGNWADFRDDRQKNKDANERMDSLQKFMGVPLSDPDIFGQTIREFHHMSMTRQYLKHHKIKKIKRGSMEFSVMQQCYGQLVVPLKPGEALLYYNQNGYGTMNVDVLHGNCPVLKGQMWTSTMHVWNGPRPGYWAKHSGTGEYVQKVHLSADEVVHATFQDGVLSAIAATKAGKSGKSSGKESSKSNDSSLKPVVDTSTGKTAAAEVSAGGTTTTTSTTSSTATTSSTTTSTSTSTALKEIAVSFHCIDIQGAELYWEDQLWQVLYPGMRIIVNSYLGHKWHVVIGNVRAASWTITANPDVSQDFRISYKALGLRPPVDKEL